MTATVKLADVLEHLAMVSDESAAYLNKRTGELRARARTLIYARGKEGSSHQRA